MYEETYLFGLDLRRRGSSKVRFMHRMLPVGLSQKGRVFKFTFITNNTDIGFITGDQLSLALDQIRIKT